MSPGELFLLELLASTKERQLMNNLNDKRKDEAARAAYVDFLREEGREQSAELVEKNHLWVRPLRSGETVSGMTGRSLTIFSGMLSSHHRVSGATY